MGPQKSPGAKPRFFCLDHNFYRHWRNTSLKSHGSQPQKVIFTLSNRAFPRFSTWKEKVITGDPPPPLQHPGFFTSKTQGVGKNTPWLVNPHSAETMSYNSMASPPVTRVPGDLINRLKRFLRLRSSDTLGQLPLQGFSGIQWLEIFFEKKAKLLRSYFFCWDFGYMSYNSMHFYFIRNVDLGGRKKGEHIYI